MPRYTVTNKFGAEVIGIRRIWTRPEDFIVRIVEVCDHSISNT